MSAGRDAWPTCPSGPTTEPQAAQLCLGKRGHQGTLWVSLLHDETAVGSLMVASPVRSSDGKTEKCQVPELQPPS